MRRAEWHFGILVVQVILTQIQISASSDDDGDRHAAVIRGLERFRREESSSDNQLSDAKILEKILHNYEQNVPPGASGRNKVPTEVKIGAYVLNVHFTENEEMEMTLYLRQTWIDKRLQFDGSVEKVMLPPNQPVPIWTPNTFFRNSLEVKEHKLPGNNIVTRISNDGTVWQAQKLTVRSPCGFSEVHKFPRHSKVCPLLIESFPYNMEVQYYSFMDHPLEMDRNLTVKYWKYLDDVLYDCSQNAATGVHGCLEYRLFFIHYLKPYLLKTYLPSVLLVVLSWLPLLIGAKHKLTAKLLPGLFAELGLLYLGSEAYDGLPEIHTVTAMHVWMGFHHALVFLSILAVIVLDKILLRRSSTKEESNKKRGNIEVDESFGPKKFRRRWTNDLITAAVFIFIYILFNIIYWNVYSVN